jgi:uncharacterized protein (TIGR00251 family)
VADDLFDVEPPIEPMATPAIVLRVRVQPGAGRAAVTGRFGAALAVRVAAPPIDGRANAATLDYVADLLGARRSQVELVSGERGRMKRIRVSGVEVERVRTVLDEELEKAQVGSGAGAKGGRGRR